MKMHNPVRVFHCRHIIKVFACSFFSMIVLSSAVWADLREFIPRPYENGADLEVNGSRETDNFRGGAAGVKTDDLFIKEKLRLYSDGYSYHPRFIQYHLMVATALKQENFTDSASGSSRTIASALEYDIKLYILPDHPYKLNLFITRLEPLYKQEFSTQINNVDSSKGAIFRYKQKPYFFNLSYIENKTENSQSTSEVKTLSANGTYFKDFSNGRKLSLSLSYDHSDYSSSSLFKGTSNIYGLNNNVELKNAMLESNFSKTTFHQESSSGPADSDNLLWRERLSLLFPLNFKSVLISQYQKNSNSFGDAGLSNQTSLSDTDKSFELDISHRLYQSLDTLFILLRDSRTSSTGDITQMSYSLSQNYSKTIPWGTFLAGAIVSRGTTDSTGETPILNESHPQITVPVPGSFVLAGQHPDRATIRVFVKDTLPPNEPILLTELTHYMVAPLGNTFQITILDLPHPQFPVSGTFDFSVSYSLSGNYKLQTDSYGYNASFNLFDNLVNPYYSYLSTTSKVLSGFFEGGPVENKFTTAGVILQKMPFRALAEYQQLESNINPYKQWKGEMNYNTSVSDTSRIYLAASYARKSYPAGSSTEEPQAYTERTATLSANIQKQFFDRSLVLTAGGSYSSFMGLIRSTVYSLNSNLEWKIGKMYISLGASGYRAKSEGAGMLQNERDHQYYYANIKRKLL